MGYAPETFETLGGSQEASFLLGKTFCLEIEPKAQSFRGAIKFSDFHAMLRVGSVDIDGLKRSKTKR